MLPCGHWIPPSGEVGTPVRRAARRGRLWGCARQSNAKHRFAGLGRHRRNNRRAERHGYQSLTARQSRNLLLISGRVDCVNPPAPLASPRSTPLSFQFPQNGEGNASYAAGASLTLCARSGDLPPRRVNARERFRFDQTPFQPTPMGTFPVQGQFLLIPYGYEHSGITRDTPHFCLFAFPRTVIRSWSRRRLP